MPYPKKVIPCNRLDTRGEEARSMNTDAEDPLAITSSGIPRPNLYLHHPTPGMYRVQLGVLEDYFMDPSEN